MFLTGDMRKSHNRFTGLGKYRFEVIDYGVLEPNALFDRFGEDRISCSKVSRILIIA